MWLRIWTNWPISSKIMVLENTQFRHILTCQFWIVNLYSQLILSNNTKSSKNVKPLKKTQLISFLSRILPWKQQCVHYTTFHTTNTHRLRSWDSGHMKDTDVNWCLKKKTWEGLACSTDAAASPISQQSGVGLWYSDYRYHLSRQSLWSHHPLPCKHDTPTHCWLSVGPASQTIFSPPRICVSLRRPTPLSE